MHKLQVGNMRGMFEHPIDEWFQNLHKSLRRMDLEWPGLRYAVVHLLNMRARVESCAHQKSKYKRKHIRNTLSNM